MDKLQLLTETIESLEKDNEAEINIYIESRALMYSFIELCVHTIGLLDAHGLKDAETDELLNRVIVIYKELINSKKKHCEILEDDINKQKELISKL